MSSDHVQGQKYLQLLQTTTLQGKTKTLLSERARCYNYSNGDNSKQFWTFLKGLHCVALVCSHKDDGKLLCGKWKKRAWARSSNPAFLTSAHLTNCCVKWSWLSDCRFPNITKTGGCSPHSSNTRSVYVKEGSDVLRRSDKHTMP